MKYIYAFFTIFFGIFTFNFFIDLLLYPFSPEHQLEIPIVLDNTIEYYEAIGEITGNAFGLIILVIVNFIFFSLFYSLYHKSKKKKKNSYDINTIKGPFVLYLRSFTDDKKTKRNVSFITGHKNEEEALVDILSEIAPVYAIGDPTDKKAPLGASRIYVDNDHWKNVVKTMAEKAVLVVLRLGRTDSFWWEVEMVLKSIPVEKIMFIIPQSKNFNNVAMLYKLLLEHGIDVKDMNITIEKKKKGSISSFLFFRNDGVPQTAEVTIPRFSRWVISYNAILRNALCDFRSKYGFSIEKKRKVRIYSIIQITLLLWMIFMSVGTWCNDYLQLKHQLPYEIVEKCVQHNVFTSKYSQEINEYNLYACIFESNKGTLALSDNYFLIKYLIEARAVKSMSKDEYFQSIENPKNMILMIKKYCPDSYDTYIDILEEATLIAITYPDGTDNLIQLYQASLDEIPENTIEALNELMDENDIYGSNIRVINYFIERIEDENTADIIKILSSQELGIDH